GGQLPICSKRRPEAIAKTVNQIAKTQKLPAKHINQGFFDPSTSFFSQMTKERVFHALKHHQRVSER
ncbi:hypothetical protein KTQ54_16860, partial [Komagataeibacter oboediens]